jgi:hypothetical protein
LVLTLALAGWGCSSDGGGSSQNGGGGNGDNGQATDDVGDTGLDATEATDATSEDDAATDADEATADGDEGSIDGTSDAESTDDADSPEDGDGAPGDDGTSGGDDATSDGGEDADEGDGSADGGDVGPDTRDAGLMGSYDLGGTGGESTAAKCQNDVDDDNDGDTDCMDLECLNVANVGGICREQFDGSLSLKPGDYVRGYIQEPRKVAGGGWTGDTDSYTIDVPAGETVKLTLTVHLKGTLEPYVAVNRDSGVETSGTCMQSGDCSGSYFCNTQNNQCERPDIEQIGSAENAGRSKLNLTQTLTSKDKGDTFFVAVDDRRNIDPNGNPRFSQMKSDIAGSFKYVYTLKLTKQ